MDFASSAKAAKTGLGGTGLLKSHLWCPKVMGWTRLD